MRKTKYLLCISMLLFLLQGCSSDSKDNAQVTTSAPAIPVDVMEAKMQDVDVILKFPARLEAKQDVTVVSKVYGTLLKQYFTPGDKVKEGDKLFLIDQEQYNNAFEVAKANVEVAKANADQAKADFIRASKLIKSKSISQKDFDTALSANEVAQASLKSAQASLKTSKLNLDYTIVTAPFDGVVGDSLKDVGSYITSEDPSLVRITNVDKIFAKFAIPDVWNLKISQNLNDKNWQKEDVYVTININNKEYKGKILYVDNVISEKTSSTEAKAVFENENNEIIPGIFSTITIYGIKQKNAFKIPNKVLQQGNVESYVLLYKDGVVAKEDVKYSYETPEFVAVYSGIKDGDLIITDNFLKIKPGTSVVKTTGQK